MAEEKASDMVEQTLNQRHLPHDLITNHILLKLPLKSLLQFKSVSKQWYSTLSSYKFSHTHLKLSSSSSAHFIFIQNKKDYYLFYCNDDDNCDDNNLFELGLDLNDDELVLIGSCNGLVCLASFSRCYFILWNPVAGKFQKYYDTELFVDSTSSFRVSWGFGYVSLIDDYKVVRILELNGSFEVWVHVYSLKSNKWTRVCNKLDGDIEFDRGNEGSFGFSYSFHTRQGILVNESLYWIVSKVNGCGRKIVAFDLGLGVFNTVVDLDLVSNEVYRDKFLCILGGCLAKCGVNMRDDVYIDMLKCHGKVESIRLSRDLRLRSCQSFVGFTQTGKFYVLLEDSTIGIINPSSQPMKYSPLVSFESLGKSRVASYFPSLILPYTGA